MRVLLVRLSAMGDVVHALGAVEALARTRPDDELFFVTQRQHASLFDELPFVTVVAHDRRPALRGWWSTAQTLHALRADVAVDLQGNWKSASLVRASAAPVRLGAVAAERREPSSAVLLTRRVRCGALHPALQAAALLRELAPALVAGPPRLPARDDEIERESQAVRASGIDPTRPFRVLVLTDPRDPRSWHRAAMLREIASGDSRALVLAGPAEADVDWSGDAPCLRHQRGDVRRLIALGALLSRCGGEAIGPDQGATHVLAAAGARTVALFGPQDPDRTAPPAARVLVARDAPACVPCGARRCRHPDGPVCMAFSSGEGVEPAATRRGGAPTS